jgi:hypothetical protein
LIEISATVLFELNERRVEKPRTEQNVWRNAADGRTIIGGTDNERRNKNIGQKDANATMKG